MEKIFFFLAAAVMFIACQDNLDDKGIKGKDMSVEASVQVMDLTGLSHDWKDEDMIGVSVDGMSDYNSETNIAFAYDAESESFMAVRSGIILKGAERGLSAYWPFTGAENEIPEEFDILTTAEYQTAEGQKANDYLFARTTATREDPVARFDFMHVMGQMRLVFEEADGKTGDISYTVSGLMHKGTFDPYTGEIRVSTTRSEDLMMEAEDMSSTLMLIPQEADVAISLTFGGKTYAGVFTAELNSNECKVYTVSISPETLDASLTITDSGSADWNVGEGGDITSEDNLEVMVSDAGSTLTRAYTDSDFKTHFENGDKIGLFAIKDGSVLPNVNNRCLTFDGKEWNAEDKMNYNISMQGAIFHAYYPYDENASVNAVSSDPFSDMIANMDIPYDQSSESTYLACDFMTGTSKAVESNGRYTLDFRMIHRMGMLSVTLPRSAYIFSNTGPAIADYVLSASSEAGFSATIGIEPMSGISPFFEEEAQSYRFIVRPGEPIALTCTFIRDGKPKKFSVNLSDGIEAGTCEPFRIDGGYNKTEMELKVGDYYCSDGSLVSYDPSVPAPENAVGVIYMTGTPAAVNSSCPDFTHGLVYALERNIRPDVEGDPGKYDMFEGDGYVSVFGLAQDKDYPYADIGLTTRDHNDTDLNGFGYTKSWLLYDGTLGANAIFRASILDYRDKIGLPEGLTTEWYLPSYDEYMLIAENAVTLNASLSHASAESVFEGTAMGSAKYYKGYWTSSMRSTGSVVNYYSLGDEDPNNNGIKQTGYVESRYGFFRYAFAF